MRKSNFLLGAILTKVTGGDSGSEPFSGERLDKEMKLVWKGPHSIRIVTL